MPAFGNHKLKIKILIVKKALKLWSGRNLYRTCWKISELKIKIPHHKELKKYRGWRNLNLFEDQDLIYF
jgi:hypothetical protein